MDFAKIVAVGITASVALALSGRPASAQQSDASAGESEFRLAYLQDRAQAGDELSLRDLDFRLTLQDEGGGASPGHTHDYKEISDFFNIREANVNTTKGEWEIEFEAEWVTDSGGGDDDFTFTPNIKYGLTDDMFIELEVLPLNIGDGGDQGNGDLALQVFYQFLRETDTMPALGTWAEARFPTGDGSSKIDAEFHLNLTKTIAPRFRAHLEGFVETANGGRGDEDENRRSFQWGVGPGFDYEIDDKTIAALNYLHRSSEELGEPDQNILEVGMVRQLAENQHLKLAVDVGVDGHDTTPNFGAKILWSFEW